ncbi:3'(2'),5'-bisphosphate nucleotidase CysQ [Alkalihalobacillus sp. BA299]|uniref:3'(2'),5'-bisphosphate nucleotidase CysQ n=1 Tax=Alkalihalobacillus sp. BA299 TaxID=2815938 RepID=UPI0027DD75CF|nr:3'(2'),5'-bisphosphate nucleotidase CysQ [Alkalihalobacillus sp. BA299]
MSANNQMDVTVILNIAVEAGKDILSVYETDFSVENKQDDSPLTLADRKSHIKIVEGLEQHYPNIPILSEEGKHQSYSERKEWDYAWVVDPLDGTKEFVKRNGEFTVNIALIKDGTPILGVIYAPVLDVAYVGEQGQGAYKVENVLEKVNKQIPLEDIGIALPIKEERDYCSVVASRSHLSKETEEYIETLKEKHGKVELTSAGSSLKLCLVAEGKADVYPRFAPTMEWDTAAGQAVVECAGGKVVTTDTNEPLKYNKENLLNPWFIVAFKSFNY